MESQWNEATKQQVIGRGARRFSHHHLPEDQRNVKVHQMVLTYPDGGKSSDTIILDNATNKNDVCDELLNELKN